MDTPLLYNNNNKYLCQYIVVLYFMIINGILLAYIVSLYTVFDTFLNAGDTKLHCFIEYICSSTLFGGELCTTCLT